MITWMQKHKKWLVITIWISTIAFVGAGFVGWGSYDYGKKGGVVATVGDREVSVDEYQEEYSNVYQQYSQMFGSNFNQELADKLNIKDVALQNVVQKNLLLSYADEIGLDVTSEDIGKELTKIPSFFKDGKFDKETYLKILNLNRTTPVKFENSLKRTILLSKVSKIFKLSPVKNELESVSKLLFMSDDIEYKILDTKSIEVAVKDDELKKYWEKNKKNYLSEESFDLNIKKVEVKSNTHSKEDMEANYNKFKLDYKKSDGTIKTFEEAKNDINSSLDKKSTKTKALKQYLKLKKGEEKFVDSKNYMISKLPFGAENNTKIKEAKNQDLIKPFLVNNEYVIVKVIKRNIPEPLSFEKAKSIVEKEYIQVQKAKQLDNLATKELKSFKGTELKDITRESIDRINGLNQQESSQFLNKLFSDTTKMGSVKLNNKIVIFKIINSRFGKYEKSKDEVVKGTLEQMQESEIMTNLLKKLSNTYQVKVLLDLK